MVETAEAAALFGAGVGEDREVARRVVEPGELEPGVLSGAVRGLRGERGRVAAREIGADRGAAFRRVDQHKAPRLAQAHRWRQASGLDQPLDRARGQGIAAETAHITTPRQQLAEPGAEAFVELGSALGRRRHGFPYAPGRRGATAIRR